VTLRVSFLRGEQAVSVVRGGRGVDAAVEHLLAGPNGLERDKGIRTQLPAGVPVRSLGVAGGVASIDLGEKLLAGRGADALSARVAQLVLTLTAVPEVDALRLRVQGTVRQGLYPGLDLRTPITADGLVATDPPPPSAPAPPTGPVDLQLLQDEGRLMRLGFLDPAEVDGRKSAATANAILAFQKWQHRLPRNGKLGGATRLALDLARRPTPQTRGTGEKRVEVLLDRQVALVVVDEKVVRVLGVSTGRAGFETLPGAYKVRSKARADWSLPYAAWLPWAATIAGGVAFHEWPVIASRPSSHGSIRLAPGDAEWLYRRLTVGTPVTVLGHPG